VPFGNFISRLAVLVLATAALGAPAASAMPVTPVHRDGATPLQDVRTEAAKASPERAPQPTVPTPLKAVVTDGGGVDGPLVGLIIAGTLAAACTMAAVALARGPRLAH
jgi:hypothetical protein